MVSLSRQYPFKFFQGCLPQIVLDPFWNTSCNILVLIIYSTTKSCYGEIISHKYNDNDDLKNKLIIDNNRKYENFKMLICFLIGEFLYLPSLVRLGKDILNIYPSSC